MSVYAAKIKNVVITAIYKSRGEKGELFLEISKQEKMK
jgi:hypothetical protein